MITLKLNSQPISKAQEVVLKRIDDGALFVIQSACVLKLPNGLAHVVGQPQEQLDTDIWDVSRHFEVLLCIPFQEPH